MTFAIKLHLIKLKQIILAFHDQNSIERHRVPLNPRILKG